MPDPHATPVVEVDHFGRLAEAQHVGSQHAMMRSQRGDVVLPADFGAGAELPTVQQDDGITLARLEIAGDETVNLDGFPLDLHCSGPSACGTRKSEHLGGHHLELAFDRGINEFATLVPDLV